MKNYYILDKFTLTFFTLVIATLAVMVLVLIKMSGDIHPDAVKWLAAHPDLVTVSRSYDNDTGMAVYNLQNKNTKEPYTLILSYEPCRR